jgi:hypothetical protein
VRDEHTVDRPDIAAVIVLQDGRQLDGILVKYEYLMQCERTVFEPYEVDGIYPQ